MCVIKARESLKKNCELRRVKSAKMLYYLKMNFHYWIYFYKHQEKTLKGSRFGLWTDLWIDLFKDCLSHLRLRIWPLTFLL